MPTPEPMTEGERIERLRWYIEQWKRDEVSTLLCEVDLLETILSQRDTLTARNAALAAEVEQVKCDAFEDVTALRLGVRDMLDATDDLIQFTIHELDCEETEALERLRTARYALQQLLGEGLRSAASQPEGAG